MTKSMKQYEVLKWASLFLEKNNCEPMVAEILLQHHLSLDRTEFYAHMHDDVPYEVFKKLQKDIKKHVKTRIPVQHLTGFEIFYGRKFYVNKHVLIPRPETEELVHHIIETAKENGAREERVIVDVGTGSGVIAITLALELPNVSVYATDLSENALAVAKRNAQKYAAHNITFLQGDFLKPLIMENKRAQMIVSNPPYISVEEKTTLSKTVSEFDPALALFAEEDGLAAYKTIVEQAKEVAYENGLLAFEIGYTQGEAVQAIIESHFPNSQVTIIQDINRKDRIVTAKLP